MTATLQSITGNLGTQPMPRDYFTLQQPHRIPDPIERPSASRVLALAKRLQTTLMVEELIELFATEVAHDIPHDGVAFLNEEEDIRMQLGYRALHCCEYRLTLNDQNLGHLSFMRRRRFVAAELTELENLINHLVYPLRNALMYRQALHTAHKDPLTGVKNRAALDSAMERELHLARRQNRSFSILLLDIDHFKRINDTWGHPCGDAALRAVAHCIAETIRGSDILFRYGGEEFVILLSDTDAQGALQLAERIRQALERLECDYDNQSIRLTASLGIATLQDNEAAHALLKRADDALYQAKATGRNRVVLAYTSRDLK